MRAECHAKLQSASQGLSGSFSLPSLLSLIPLFTLALVLLCSGVQHTVCCVCTPELERQSQTGGAACTVTVRHQMPAPQKTNPTHRIRQECAAACTLALNASTRIHPLRLYTPHPPPLNTRSASTCSASSALAPLGPHHRRGICNGFMSSPCTLLYHRLSSSPNTFPATLSWGQRTPREHRGTDHVTANDPKSRDSTESHVAASKVTSQ